MKQIKTISAQQLATTTKGRPFWEPKTPIWLLNILEKRGIENAIYRANKVENITPFTSFKSNEFGDIDKGRALFDIKPKEYTLAIIQSLIEVPNRIVDLYNIPFNQLNTQFQLTIDNLLERKEKRIISSLLEYSKENKKSSKIKNYPTPHDLDILISQVWKKPSFFLMAPEVQARFGQSCTEKGVCIGTVEIFGHPFWTWRGIPIIPTDKLNVKNKKSQVLLVRMGENDNGIFEIYNKAQHNHSIEGITIKETGIDENGLVGYLISMYYNIVIPTHDAIFYLECNIP